MPLSDGVIATAFWPLILPYFTLSKNASLVRPTYDSTEDHLTGILSPLRAQTSLWPSFAQEHALSTQTDENRVNFRGTQILHLLIRSDRGNCWRADQREP